MTLTVRRLHGADSGALAELVELDAPIKTTKKRLVEDLAALGYRIDESLSFNYVNGHNPGPAYPARSNYIVEADTGISFAHFSLARRDDRFRALQEFRYHDRLIGGRRYEL
ncbi:MAG: hypothetical protein V4527_18935 [Pseudomonadota bacterium]